MASYKSCYLYYSNDSNHISVDRLKTYTFNISSVRNMWERQVHSHKCHFQQPAKLLECGQ